MSTAIHHAVPLLASLALVGGCGGAEHAPPKPESPPAVSSPPATSTEPALAPDPPPAIPSAVPEFHLVAARTGALALHPRGDALLLVGTVPYPVASDGTVQPLQDAARGLLPIDPDDDIIKAVVAGGFTGPDDGWLVLQAKSAGRPHKQRGVPVAYQWTGSGWRLLRERTGATFRSYDHVFERGDSVFAHTHDSRLSHPQAAFVDAEAKQPPPTFSVVRLRGDTPEPRVPPQVCALADLVNAPGGAVHALASTCDDTPAGRCHGECTVELHTWSPGTGDPLVTPLPELPRLPALADAGAMGLALTADGVLVFGDIHENGAAQKTPYLAAGPPNAPRRVPFACGTAGCGGPLVSAAAGDDGSYWLVMNDALWQYRPDAGLRPVPLAPPQWPDLEEWYWGPHETPWRRAGDWARESLKRDPIAVDQIVRVRDSLWVHVRIVGPYDGRVIEAVFTTGPHHDPVALPGDNRLLGEAWRLLPSSHVVRVLGPASATDVQRFEAEVLPQLRAREDVWQVYEGHGEPKQVFAVLDPSAPQTSLKALASVLARPSEPVSPPPDIARMLHDRDPD